MGEKQMDPAPATKAGESKAESVWVPGAAALMKPEKLSEEAKGLSELLSPKFDESKMVTAVKSYTPPSFFERDAYKQLQEMNLESVPGSGFTLAYHTVTQQWHARNSNGENYAPAWGKHRTELCALTMALDALWQ